jgi:hypothetical protein
MNLNENIYRIKSLMTENKEIVLSLIKDMGIYDSIRYFGGFDRIKSKLGDYEFSKDEMVQFIKEIVTKLCDEMDDIEVGGNDFGNRIVYKETEDQIHLIEFYRREGVVIERYVTSGDDYDDGDNYIGGYLKRYKDLSPSIITEIFYLLLTQI